MTFFKSHRSTDQKATFFVIAGNNAHRHKQLLIKAVQDGHQLANHGITETTHALKSRLQVCDEIAQCNTFISEIYTESKVSLPSQCLYRPGGGWLRSYMLGASFPAKIALGSLYPHDPFIKCPLLNFEFVRRRVRGGDVVILHDRSHTPPMLQKLLPELQRRQLKSVTLESLLAK